MHAIGYPDAANVVSWALSAMLIWFAWRVIRTNTASVVWSAFWVAGLCVGIYPVVWHVTGGAHAMGDLAMAAAIVAFADRDRLLTAITTTGICGDGVDLARVGGDFEGKFGAGMHRPPLSICLARAAFCASANRSAHRAGVHDSLAHSLLPDPVMDVGTFGLAVRSCASRRLGIFDLSPELDTGDVSGDATGQPVVPLRDRLLYGPQLLSALPGLVSSALFGGRICPGLRAQLWDSCSGCSPP